MAYARACVDCVHAASRGFDTGAISIAMIEGSALGGGLRRHWLIILCWHRQPPEWVFRRLHLIYFLAWGIFTGRQKGGYEGGRTTDLDWGISRG